MELSSAARGADGRAIVEPVTPTIFGKRLEDGSSVFAVDGGSDRDVVRVIHGTIYGVSGGGHESPRTLTKEERAKRDRLGEGTTDALLARFLNRATGDPVPLYLRRVTTSDADEARRDSDGSLLYVADDGTISTTPSVDAGGTARYARLVTRDAISTERGDFDRGVVSRRIRFWLVARPGVRCCISKRTGLCRRVRRVDSVTGLPTYAVGKIALDDDDDGYYVTTDSSDAILSDGGDPLFASGMTLTASAKDGGESPGALYRLSSRYRNSFDALGLGTTDPVYARWTVDSNGQSVPVYVALTGGVTTNRNDAKTNAAGDLIFALGATTDVSKAETETLGG